MEENVRTFLLGKMGMELINGQWYDKDLMTLAKTSMQDGKIEFEEAKKNFRIAARDKEKKIKTQANNWIKYTENEEIRVKNLALRRDYIQMNSSS